MSWLSRAAGIGLALVLNLGSATAAELRVSFAELAGIVQDVIVSAKVHLNNKPGGLLSFTSDSYVQVAGQQIPVPLPPKSFDVLGSTYAYYVDDLNTSAVKVSAVSGALRLTLAFESKGAEIVGGCVKGGCSLSNALPVIDWDNGSVSIDFVPVRYGASMALQAKSVTIGGTMRATCTSSGGFFSEGACEVALPWANRAVAKLKPDLAAMMKEKINDPQIQAQVAGSLKKYLTVGTYGEIAITDVSSDSKGVTITFRLPGPVSG